MGHGGGAVRRLVRRDGVDRDGAVNNGINDDTQITLVVTRGEALTISVCFACAAHCSGNGTIPQELLGREYIYLPHMLKISEQIDRELRALDAPTGEDVEGWLHEHRA